MFKDIKGFKKIITAMGYKIDFIDDRMISVEHCLWHILIDENYPGKIFLNFLVEIGFSEAADITKRLSYLAFLINMNVVVNDVYAFEFDEAGNAIDMIFGYEAFKTARRIQCS